MTHAKFATCTNNSGYEASLELRKLYQLIPDQQASAVGQVRVIDESSEDYLYPLSYFYPVNLPVAVAEQIAHAT